jgi:hypothetical protein
VAIARRGTPTQVGGTVGSTSSGALGVPTGTVDDDGLLLVLWLLGTNTLSITAGLSGWTLKRTTPVGTTATCLLYSRVASSEPASYTATLSASCRTIAQMTAYSGTDTTDFVEADDSATGGTSVHTTPSVSSADASDWAFAYFADRTSTSSQKTVSWTPGAGISETAAFVSNNAAGSSPWGTLDVCDSNGTIATGAHSYSDTASRSQSNAVAGLVILKAAASGPASVDLNPATLSLSGITIVATPTVTLAPAAVNLTGQPLLATPTVALAPGMLTLSGQPVTPAAQPVTVNLAPGLVTLASQPVVARPTVAFAPATLGLAGQPLTPAAQPVTVALAPATLALAVQPLGATGTGVVALNPGTLTLSGRPVTPTPTVQLAPATLGLSAPAVDPTPMVALAPAVLALTGQPLDAQPGAVSVDLEPSLLTLTPNPLVLPAGLIVHRPTGPDVVRPTGAAVTRPGGTAVTRPPGDRVLRPTGPAVDRP